jgi:hypothetical protein
MKFVKICAFLLFLPAAAAAAEFHGYPCTRDCSGHEAGYEWAERKGVSDPDECGGNSESFREGCRAWAEEQAEDMPEENAAEDGADAEE